MTKIIRYKNFKLVPFFDKVFGDYGVDITDNTAFNSEIPSITAAESEVESIEWAKEVCDNKRLFEKDGFIL